MSTVYGKKFNINNLTPSHLKIVEIVGSGKHILELGCSSGYLTQRFQENKNLVDIVEIDQDDIKKASKYANKTFAGSLEESEFLSSINGNYDVVVAADVLEHLSSPEKILAMIKKVLNKEGRLVISIPNVACWPIRKELFFNGKFEYTETGVLDKTHLRFYTFNTIGKLLKENGFQVKKIDQMEIFYPFRNSIKKIPAVGPFIDFFLKPFFETNFPNLSTTHMIITATP